MQNPQQRPESASRTLEIVPFLHPQGCRSFLIADPLSGQALALDVHLDLVQRIAGEVRGRGWTLPYVLDSHTHADHPSGSSALAAQFSSTRMAHKSAQHSGVTRHPKDGETLHLGDQELTVYHTPGHTPDHLVLVTGEALFSGDTLLIGGVARTDFLGGDAGQLYDSIHRLLDNLPGETILYPSHDYEGRVKSTLAEEKRSNPWLAIEDRAEFVKSLTANPPPRPANMDALLQLNRESVDIPAEISAAEAVERVRQGGAKSVLDVRTEAEYGAERIAGATLVPLDQLQRRVDEVRGLPAPRMLLCRTDTRARMARETLEGEGLAGLSVVTGGIEAFRAAGGETFQSGSHMSLERQVRIAAGSLVVLGVGLGALIHPAFYALSGFVGAGLVFAGVTDTCGMGMLLARMPWNKGGGSACSLDGGSAGGTCAAQPPASGGCSAQPPA